jgi:hypothetical protein
MSVLERGVTLDGLFRANAAARPTAIAISDPSNRASFTDGVALRLSYAEVDARVERLALRLGSFGMPLGSVVAVQLPNISESVIALLAILRAGMIAAPVPTLWRKSDLVASLGELAPRAFIALSHLDGERPAEMVCAAAGELFDLSFPCAFGQDVPDGFIALDREDELTGGESQQAAQADLSLAALVTFDTDADGYFAVRRSDAQWVAAGLSALLECNVKAQATIINTLPLNSLAGIGAAFIPWLLSGGTLELVHGHAPEAVRSAAIAGGAHLVAPAAALPDLTRQPAQRFSSCLAVHRGGWRQAFDFSNLSCESVVDFHCFGEIAAVALARDTPAQARAVPLGGIVAQSAAITGPVTIESRLTEGQIWFRGPMVPREVFPAAAVSRLKQDAEGFVCTGFTSHSDGNGGLVVDAGPEQVVAIGGLRFGLNDLRTRFSACGEDIKVGAIDDPLLGQRLHIEAAKPDLALAAMHAAGHSPLVIDAMAGAVCDRPAR